MRFLKWSSYTLEIQTAQKWANCPRLWCTGLAHTKHYKDEPHNGTDTAKNSDVKTEQYSPTINFIPSLIQKKAFRQTTRQAIEVCEKMKKSQT